MYSPVSSAASSSSSACESDSKRLFYNSSKSSDVELWWLARETLREEEKAFSKLKDSITLKRRNLPWLRVPDNWCFEGSNGIVSFKSLFGEHEQLIVYNLMSFEDYPCSACTMIVEQLNSISIQLGQHTAVAVISHSPYERLKACAQFKNWHLPIYACDGDFTMFIRTENVDRLKHHGNASSLPAMTSFARGSAAGGEGTDPNGIYLAYATHERGVEDIECYLGWIDRLPLLKNKAIRQPALFNWKAHFSAPQLTNEPATVTKPQCCCSPQENPKVGILEDITKTDHQIISSLLSPLGFHSL